MRICWVYVIKKTLWNIILYFSSCTRTRDALGGLYQLRDRKCILCNLSLFSWNFFRFVIVALSQEVCFIVVIFTNLCHGTRSVISAWPLFNYSCSLLLSVQMVPFSRLIGSYVNLEITAASMDLRSSKVLCIIQGKQNRIDLTFELEKHIWSLELELCDEVTFQERILFSCIDYFIDDYFDSWARIMTMMRVAWIRRKGDMVDVLCRVGSIEKQVRALWLCWWHR